MDWLVNLYKSTGPFDSGAAARQARGMSLDDYQKIVAARPPWDLQRGILWKSLNGNEYQAEFSQASPGAFAAGVRAPIHIMHAYQDEQTGPSGVWLWTYVPDDVPKRLVLSNGDHGDVGQFNRERMEWLDFWTLGDGQERSGRFHRSPDRRVQSLLRNACQVGSRQSAARCRRISSARYALDAITTCVLTKRSAVSHLRRTKGAVIRTVSP